MSQTLDLQIQSTASDGKHTPREIIGMAKEQGVGIVAITDHDTVDGVLDALVAGNERGVRVIPGIEMSVDEYGAHILGYGINVQDAELQRRLSGFQESRIAGAKKMIQNLRAAGFVVDWEDVEREATGKTVARPHIARAIMSRAENKEKLGDATTVHAFIEKFLTDESPHYVPRSTISAKDAIALLHASGGVAIWSHPAIHFRNNYDGLEQFLSELMGWGLDGLEVCNPSHTEDDVEFLEGLSAQHNLLRTAGSDFHEAGAHPRDATTGLHSAETIGDFETYGFSIETIVEKLDAAIAARAQDK